MDRMVQCARSQRGHLVGRKVLRRRRAKAEVVAVVYGQLSCMKGEGW